jgi:hypothetical protein
MIFDLGGEVLLKQKYEGSLYLLLSKIYPDYNWLPWNFDNNLLNYWEDMKNQKKFIEWVETQLNIKGMTGWYEVSNKVRLSKTTTEISRNFPMLVGIPY